MRRSIPVIRKAVQVGVLLVLLSIPLLSRGASVYQQYGKNGYDFVELFGSKEEYVLYLLFDHTLGRWQNGVAWMDKNKGWIWNLSLSGISISDPLAVIGYMVSNRNWHIPFLLSLVIPLGLVLVTGRSFCGWICPVNSLLEWNDRIRKTVVAYIFGKPLDVQAPLGTKNWILLGGVGIAAVSGISVFPFILPYVVMGREIHLLLFWNAFSFGIYFLIGLVLFELLISRRGWCRYLCPTGGLLTLLSRPAMLKIAQEERKCREGCSVCKLVCPIQIDPKSKIEVKDCFQCGTCVARCPEELLRFSWTPRPVPTAVALALVLLAVPFSAWAHHIRGLPHYGYTENYPQAPVNEFEIRQNGYTAFVTTYYFQGLNVQASDTPNAVQFFVYLEEETAKRPYTGPLTLEIWDGQNRVFSKKWDSPIEESSYRFRTQVPKGDYKLVLVTLDRSLETAVKLGPETDSYLKLYLLAGSAAFVLFMAGFRKKLRAFARKRSRPKPEPTAA